MLYILHKERADCVQNGKDHDAHIGEDGEPHIGQTDCAEEEAEKLDADGEDDILVHDAHAFPGNPDGLGNFQGIIVHEDHIGGFDGSI